MNIIFSLVTIKACLKSGDYDYGWVIFCKLVRVICMDFTLNSQSCYYNMIETCYLGSYLCICRKKFRSANILVNR